MFQKLIDSQLSRVQNCPQADMLEDTVYEKLRTTLFRLTEQITKSTADHWIGQEAAAENPLAAALPELLTARERQKTVDVLRRKIDSGELSVPPLLLSTLTARLSLITDAFLEMLARMEAHREDICAALTNGRLYTKIKDIDDVESDTHNGGRHVAVLVTDAGRLVYKPRDLRGNQWVYAFAERFFPEFVGVPRTVAFGDRFGVCEAIEKRRAEGEKAAQKFWYNLGGLTFFAKLLGSSDLHQENVFACGEKPFLIDLETLFSPLSAEQETSLRFSRKAQLLSHSPAQTLLLPCRVNEYELSVLMDDSEKGSLPVVGGKRVTVRPYLHFYKQGYKDAYDRALERREEIFRAASTLPPRLPIRIVPRATRGYYALLKTLSQRDALKDQTGYDAATKELRHILTESWKNAPARVIESEIRQLHRGDIPYFCTYTDSHSLFGDGEEVLKDGYRQSGAEHLLSNIAALSKEDEIFDLAYLEQAVSMYANRRPDGGREKERPHDFLRRVPLEKEAAAREAEKIFEEMAALQMPLPDGNPIWGSVGGGNYSLLFSDHSLYNGYTGLAVFAAACAHTLGRRAMREMTGLLLEQTAKDLHALCRQLKSELNPDHAAPLGEASGLGGVLTGLALLRRYTSSTVPDALTEEVLDVLLRTDFDRCREPDRCGGLAGLLSALCRFPEYRENKSLIRRATDRLLALKTFEYKGGVLWKTLYDKPRVLSGAGHGMAGIAEALFSASSCLADTQYLPAAREALAYEEKVYDRYGKKFGGFADLRDFPPLSAMNGYCSGAPGIGILLKRMEETGLGGEAVKNLSARTRESADRHPLNVCDHLCCANAALAEYYLTAGDENAASGVLGAMLKRRQAEGNYRYSAYETHNSVNASLFYGMSGIGYEMLRFAFPDKVCSVL